MVGWILRAATKSVCEVKWDSGDAFGSRFMFFAQAGGYETGG